MAVCKVRLDQGSCFRSFTGERQPFLCPVVWGRFDPLRSVTESWVTQRGGNANGGTPSSSSLH